MQHIKYTAVTENLVPSLAELHIQCWKDTYTGIIEDAFLSSLHLKDSSVKQKNTSTNF